MNRIKLPVLAAVALVIAGCQTAKQLAHDEQVSIFRPELWLKDDGLYYAAGADEPYTGKHEAWYINGDKAWEGEMLNGKRHGEYTQWYPENGGQHVAGLYQDGSRDGAWGQWYPNGKAEIHLRVPRGLRVEGYFLLRKRQSRARESLLGQGSAETEPAGLGEGLLQPIPLIVLPRLPRLDASRRRHGE